MPEVNLVTCSRLQASMRVECLDFTAAHGISWKVAMQHMLTILQELKVPLNRANL